jgi:hypothetical protein
MIDGIKGFHVNYQKENGYFDIEGGIIIPIDGFLSLSQKQKDYLVHLMAEISEKSYRRGFQHGVFVSENKEPLAFSDIFEWRYSPPGISIGYDGFTTSTIYRLYIENCDLATLGFRFEEIDLSYSKRTINVR